MGGKGSGGSREGAGRKKAPHKYKKFSMCATHEEYAELVRLAAESNKTLSRFLVENSLPGKAGKDLKNI